MHGFWGASSAYSIATLTRSVEAFACSIAAKEIRWVSHAYQETTPRVAAPRAPRTRLQIR